MKKKRKFLSNFRNLALAHGPLKTRTKGTKKGKRGYSRKNKSWKKSLD